MTRRTLTDRAVANLGVTNELSEKTASTSRYAGTTQIDTTQAGKTASDFIDYAPASGMTVGHASITANIHFGTDGLTFSGVKNGSELQSWSAPPLRPRPRAQTSPAMRRCCSPTTATPQRGIPPGARAGPLRCCR